MADLSITPYRGIPGSRDDRALRADRRHTRGLMSDSRTGFSTRNRRGFIEQAKSITASTFPLSVATVRRRYQRKLWSLQDAVATANPSS